MSRMKQVIAALEAERDDAKERLDWIEAQLDAFKERAGDAVPESGPSVPSRSNRRATSRRASKRRATARSHRGDTASRIVDYLGKHPNSTAGDLAKGLDLRRNSVSTKLTQMAKQGKIRKAQRGYTTV
jgi:predicted Rossmann fold nucleotide-binding protein DprA/Smf involved in DNA uptake